MQVISNLVTVFSFITVTDLSLDVTTVGVFQCFNVNCISIVYACFTLVMFKLPALIPVLVTDGPPVIV